MAVETCRFKIAAVLDVDWLTCTAECFFFVFARYTRPNISKKLSTTRAYTLYAPCRWLIMDLDLDPNSRANRRKRQASLYDAVAGRVGYEGFLGEDPPTKDRDTVSRSDIPVPPEEVLFRRRGAPIRYEEDDIYCADRHLEPHQRLPDSDLLKTIHAYASDFYANAAPDGGKSDFKSLDETALLAMGILLEEAAAEALGKTGDLALVEAAVEDQLSRYHSGTPGFRSGNTLKRSVVERSQSAQARSARTSSRSRSVKRQRSESVFSLARSDTTRSRSRSAKRQRSESVFSVVRSDGSSSPSRSIKRQRSESLFSLFPSET